MRLAHFTLAELPGTLSIWVAGIALGVALLTRDLRRLALPLPLVLMSCIAVVSMLGDRLGWPEAARVGLDLAFLALAAGCVWVVTRRPVAAHPSDSAARRASAGSS